MFDGNTFMKLSPITKKWIIISVGLIVLIYVVATMAALVMLKNSNAEAAHRFAHDPASARVALRTNPQNAAAHWGLAQRYLGDGNKHAAIPEFQAAYRLDPHNKFAGNMLAHLLASEKRYTEARIVFKQLADSGGSEAEQASKDLREMDRLGWNDEPQTTSTSQPQPPTSQTAQ